jgi:DNA topoisomerase-2
MRLDNKIRFFLMVFSGELQINNRKEAFIIQDLRIEGFDPESRLDANIDPLADQDAEGPKAKVDNEHDYDYLLDMTIRRLSQDKVEEFKKQRDAKNAELKILIDKTAIDLWNEDLDDFTAAWEQRLEKDLEEAQQMTTNKSSGKSTVGKKTKSRKCRR